MRNRKTYYLSKDTAEFTSKSQCTYIRQACSCFILPHRFSDLTCITCIVVHCYAVCIGHYFTVHWWSIHNEWWPQCTTLQYMHYQNESVASLWDCGGCGALPGDNQQWGDRHHQVGSDIWLRWCHPHPWQLMDWQTGTDRIIYRSRFEVCTINVWLAYPAPCMALWKARQETAQCSSLPSVYFSILLMLSLRT